MDGTYAAVVDRIVDGETAVLLVESGGEVVDQRDLAVDRLPAEGRHEGAVLALSLSGGAVVDVAYRPAETDERRETAAERFDRLSRRLGDDEE